MEGLKGHALSLTISQWKSSSVAKPNDTKPPRHTSPLSPPRLWPLQSPLCVGMWSGSFLLTLHGLNHGCFPHSLQVVNRLWKCEWPKWFCLNFKEQKWVSNPSLLPPNSVCVSWHSVERITTENLDAVLVACQNANIEIIRLVYRTTRKYGGVLFFSGTSAIFRVL